MTRLGRLAPAVPNALTIARIFAIPPLVVLVLESHDGSSLTAAGLFALAALSDALDGHLARSRDHVTTFGKIADPIADKLLVGAALVSLVAMDRLAAWVAVVIMARELAVSGLRAVAGREGLVISASRFGKAKMLIQVVTILALIAAPDVSAAWLQALVYGAVAVTIASGVDYFVAFRRRRLGEPVAVRAARPAGAERDSRRAAP
ncbi:MAG TPA: CDP-diacylglycerol--glycerol-3-phosphate 3-phosphatidyltransferase [Thermoleophilaceae bacterium]|nr:CDP-diacylglycerol--glycerol-3-phosphate 3-phosphatidyltransferase [Thermoleophilaceae bacterium]